MHPSRRTELIAKLPPELRAMYEAELAAGNELNDVELGRGENEGKIAVVVNHPFLADHSKRPPGISYRESENRHLLLFEYHTADGRFSLLTAKFKPMVLPKLPPGPPNPTEAHVARMNKRAEEEASAAARRKSEPPPPPPHVTLSAEQERSLADPAKRFLASMNVTYDTWHDGLSYDLEALKLIPPGELETIENILVHHEPRDWRDVEALAQIDSPGARRAVEDALLSRDANVRRVAMEHAGEKLDPRNREKLLVRSLETDVIFGGLTAAIDEVPEFHPPAVLDALFRGVLRREGDVAVHFAALLTYLHGKAKEPFDWDQRPFFLRFNTEDRAERKAAFIELCDRIGVDAKAYLR